MNGAYCSISPVPVKAIGYLHAFADFCQKSAGYIILRICKKITINSSNNLLREWIDYVMIFL